MFQFSGHPEQVCSLLYAHNSVHQVQFAEKMREGGVGELPTSNMSFNVIKFNVIGAKCPPLWSGTALS